MFDAQELAQIEALLRRVLATPAGQGAQWLPRRLTAEEFAVCLEVHPETARRYLRDNEHGIVKKKLAVLQGNVWRIDITALAVFGVTPALAASRLQASQAQAAAESSPAALLPPAAESQTASLRPL